MICLICWFVLSHSKVWQSALVHRGKMRQDLGQRTYVWKIDLVSSGMPDRKNLGGSCGGISHHVSCSAWNSGVSLEDAGAISQRRVSIDGCHRCSQKKRMVGVERTNRRNSFQLASALFDFPNFSVLWYEAPEFQSCFSWSSGCHRTRHWHSQRLPCHRLRYGHHRWLRASDWPHGPWQGRTWTGRSKHARDKLGIFEGFIGSFMPISAFIRWQVMAGS